MKRFLAFMLALLMLLSLLPSVLADSPHTHNWKEKSRVNPTCTKDGYAVYVCSCGSRKTEKLAALGHEFSQQVYVSYADCEHYGVFYWVCERCGEHSPTGNDKPLGHDWDGGVVTLEPTETDYGIMTYTCKRDPSHTRIEAIPALGSGEVKPELQIAWLYDAVERNGSIPGVAEHMTEPYILWPGDQARMYYTVTNTGNIPLKVVHYAEWDNGATDRYCFGLYTAPGKTETEVWGYANKDGRYYDPGSETDGLLGTVTIHYYAVGEYKGEEVCRTETITHTWTFGKNVEPEDLGDGLLLKKGYEAPKNGEYFTEGEQISWILSVTNNSKESITNVKVDDQGVTVGEYAELKPNDKENCAVPKHTVTEYEAKVVGYVLNSATATGTDYLGATKTWPSNVAKAITKKPTAPGEDPKGDPYGLHPAISIIKAEDPAGPGNGSYYEADETIKYTITVKNVGDTELKDIAVTDSLAGFAPIGTLASLAPNEEKTFEYSYTVKEEDLPYQWVYNSATVTYTFGDSVNGTPVTSNTVDSRVGDSDDPIPPHLDPDKLPEGDDWCRLTLEYLGDTEAVYTLHACAEHAEAAMAAEEAAANGDWKAAADIWQAEAEELYQLLYNAADSQLKGALITERAMFYDSLDSFDPLTVDQTVRSMKANVDSLYGMLLAAADENKKAELLAEKEKLYADIDASYGGSEGEARANALRLKCAFLCCALHTVPDELPSSLAGDRAQMTGCIEATETARVFGALDGADSEVRETYFGAALNAQNGVIGLLGSARSYDADDVFARGVQLWQIALDSEVGPAYEAADEEQKKLIGCWRVSLDTLYAAEKDFLALLYEGGVTQQELLMDIYKDAALLVGFIK